MFPDFIPARGCGLTVPPPRFVPSVNSAMRSYAPESKFQMSMLKSRSNPLGAPAEQVWL